jgi:hypothetical protein
MYSPRSVLNAAYSYSPRCIEQLNALGCIDMMYVGLCVCRLSTAMYSAERGSIECTHHA